MEQPDSKTVSFQLDANGNRTRLIYPDGYFVDYTFDQLDRLTDIKLNGALDSAAHYDYDARSRRTKTMRSNGSRSIYLYNSNNDLVSLTHILNPNKRLVLSYQYNGAHELIGQTTNSDDLLSQPEPSSASYVTNNLNQYTAVATDTVSHDSNGNLTENGPNTTFNFNTENQLTGCTIGGLSTNFKYDALGRRAVISEDEGTTQRLIYDGYKHIAVYDEADNLIKRNVFGASLEEPLLSIAVPDETATLWYQDQIGSVIAGTDNGSIQAQYSYSPFGKRTKIAGSGPDADFGFAGLYHHDRSGLNLTLFRAYDSRLGRWLSRAPIGEAAGTNLYAYVANDPVRFTDPLGLYVYVDVWLSQSGSTIGLSNSPNGGSVMLPNAEPYSAQGYKQNNPAFIYDKSGPNMHGGPIPPGAYHLSPEWKYLDGRGYKLYPFAPKLNRQGAQTLINPKTGKPVTRDNFWLGGDEAGGSEGCIHTQSSSAWDKLKQILNTTSTRTINVEGVPIQSPGEIRVHY